MADYSEQQLKDAARKALAAGDNAAAKRLIDAARAAAKTQPAAAPQAQPKTNLVEQTGTGVNEGISSMVGGPVDLATWAMNKGISGANSIFGTDMGQIENPVGGSQSVEGLLSPFMSDVAPQTTAQRIGRRAGKEVGANSVPMLALASKPAKVAQASTGVIDDMARAAQDNFGKYAALDTASAASGGTAAGISQEVAPGNKTAEFIASMAGSMTPVAIAANSGRKQANTAMREAVPTVEQHKKAAGELYDLAEAKGFTAGQKQTTKLAENVRSIAAGEGLISPTGRINNAYPKAREAISLLDDFATGSMTPTQMKTVRGVLSDAAQSVDPKEARIATMMLKEYDSFTSKFIPQIAEANKLYTKAMGGQMIETAIELAGSQAGQFTGSGFENALRTQFRALDRKIIKGQLKGLSPDAIAAIKRVANGGPMENILRDIGKAAPTGVVSAGIGGGVPFLMGNAVGGPALGTAAAIGTMGTGSAARMAATNMQKKNADVASAILRGGTGLESAPLINDTTRGVLSALTTSAGVSSLDKDPKDRKKKQK